MSEEVYRLLAQRLDMIPNGFPATQSGVELRILARLFTAEQARLATVMRLTPEPSADIAARAGLEARAAHAALKNMARQGLIRAEASGRQVRFGLLQFIVGFYEAQRPRLDAELAALMEQYFAETRGIVAFEAPSVHRVIPVSQAIDVGVEVFPYEHAERLVSEAKSWAVGTCICRLQRSLVGQACGAPLEACLWFAPVENAFQGITDGRALNKEEALDVLHACAEAGLVHTVRNQRDGIYYICNCCTCCCGILRAATEFGRAGAVAHSAFRSAVREEACAGCGACVERCHFGALSLVDDLAVVDAERCVGCGLCASACEQGALHLERVPGQEPAPPKDEAAWYALRAERRGLSLADIV